MATPIIMPKFGQMTEESAIVEWLKKEGDKINKGDILFTVETDKSVMEVESFEAGTLLKIVVAPHVNVPVQSTVGFLGNPGEAIPAVTAPAPAATKNVEPVGTPASGTARPEKVEKRAVPEAGAPLTPAPLAPLPAPAAPSLFRISPRAATLAKHSVIDARRIKGTGPEGRIVEKTCGIICSSTVTTSCASAPPRRSLRPRKTSMCWRFKARMSPAASAWPTSSAPLPRSRNR